MIRPLLLTCCLAAASTASTLDQLRGYAPCFLQTAHPVPCLKERALRLFDKALLTDSIKFSDGFAIEKNPEEISANFDASDELNLPAEPSAREEQLDELLWKRTLTFFKTRSVRIDLEETAQEGRLFKKKIKKFVIPLILVKVGLALMATKALLIGKLALAVTLFVIVREFFEERKKAQHETYEVFAKHPSESEYQHYEASSPVQSVVQTSGFYPSKGGRSIVRETNLPALDVNENAYDNGQFAQMLAYSGRRPN
ncbi:uncharacterized protein LOC132205746 [Neocloeon triangulifer]|uniref:uncharacterized protein LOC132205746 n=1 Tax=Neocloeon triangulifer TaxID=2078957 RepID=UPI00286EC7CA|nr:uncharacterized protein LOC132205746 [Neocloeon triangulifer]